MLLAGKQVTPHERLRLTQASAELALGNDGAPLQRAELPAFCFVSVSATPLRATVLASFAFFARLEAEELQMPTVFLGSSA